MSQKIWMRQKNLVNVFFCRKKLKIAPKFAIFFLEGSAPQTPHVYIIKELGVWGRSPQKNFAN